MNQHRHQSKPAACASRACSGNATARILRLGSALTCLTAALIGPSGNAIAAAYKFTDLEGVLGSPDAGTRRIGSTANGINNLGQVVGTSTFTEYESDEGREIRTTWATVWTAGVPRALRDSNERDNAAFSINNLGDAVGFAFIHSRGEENKDRLAYLFSPRGDKVLSDHYPDLWGVAYGVNDAGKIVGVVDSDRWPYGARATIWDGATRTRFDEGAAFDINNADQIVGNDGAGHAILWNGITDRIDLGLGNARAINDAGLVVGERAGHAALWNGADFFDLGTLGGALSFAAAINITGRVVGSSQDPSGIWRATLWDGTRARDLNALLDAGTVAAGWVLESATGINDSGWIVGKAKNSLTGVSHGYVLVAVPEPASLALMLTGLGVIGLFVCRLRKGIAIPGA